MIRRLRLTTSLFTSLLLLTLFVSGCGSSDAGETTKKQISESAEKSTDKAATTDKSVPGTVAAKPASSAATETSASVPAEALPAFLNPKASKSPVEVVWSAPDETDAASGSAAPDTYIIEYGLSKAVDQSLRVPARQLQVTEDDVFGRIYKIYLHNTPADKSVFVRIRSATASAVSEPSVTFEINPGTGWGKRLEQ